MAESARSKSKGVVKWFSAQKGFGFISPTNGGEDLFVHQTEIQSEGFRTLRQDQAVEYTIGTGEDGRSRATEVIILEETRGREGRFYGRGDGGRGGGGWGAECYNCGRIGHFARDCYRGARRGGYGGGRGRGGGYRGNQCYNCGAEGHFARDCPVPDSGHAE